MPGWLSTCEFCPVWAISEGQRQSTISSEELARRPGSTPPSSARTCPSWAPTASAASVTRSGTLVEEISRTLGAHRAHRVALVGLGNLGQALAGYPGFAGRGFVISALFDSDPGPGRPRSGRANHPAHQRRGRGLPVQRRHHRGDRHPGQRRPGGRRHPGVGRRPVDPELRARRAGGPAGVEVRHVDLSLELQILAFHESRRDRRRHVTVGAAARRRPSPPERSPGAGGGGGDVMTAGRWRPRHDPTVRHQPMIHNQWRSSTGRTPPRGLRGGNHWSVPQGLRAGVPPRARSTT